MPFVPFASWADVRHSCMRSGALFYHAPLDRYSVRVYVLRVFKNGKLRLRAAHRDACAFTADASHLSRCFQLE